MGMGNSGMIAFFFIIPLIFLIFLIFVLRADPIQVALACQN